MEKLKESKRKYVYKNEETDNVSIYECPLKCIKFNNFETCFYIDWHEGYGSFVVKCLYPGMIEYNFTSKSDKIVDYQWCVINHLEITGFSYLKDADGYTIQFDFDNYPIGYIRLHCTEFSFEVPSLPLSSGGNDHRIPWDPVQIEDPF